MIASHDMIPFVPAALGETDLPLPGKQSGKVRDLYPLGDPAVREAVALYQRKQAGKITDDDAALHQPG